MCKCGCLKARPHDTQVVLDRGRGEDDQRRRKQELSAGHGSNMARGQAVQRQATHYHHHCRVAGEGRRVVAPPCPRSTARLQRSPVGRVESFRSWSSQLFRGRPGGRRHVRPGGRLSDTLMLSWIGSGYTKWIELGWVGSVS